MSSGQAAELRDANGRVDMRLGKWSIAVDTKLVDGEHPTHGTSNVSPLNKRVTKLYTVRESNEGQSASGADPWHPSQSHHSMPPPPGYYHHQGDELVPGAGSVYKADQGDLSKSVAVTQPLFYPNPSPSSHPKPPKHQQQPKYKKQPSVVPEEEEEEDFNEFDDEEWLIGGDGDGDDDGNDGGLLGNIRGGHQTFLGSRFLAWLVILLILKILICVLIWCIWHCCKENHNYMGGVGPGDINSPPNSPPTMVYPWAVSWVTSVLPEPLLKSRFVQEALSYGRSGVGGPVSASQYIGAGIVMAGLGHVAAASGLLFAVFIAGVIGGTCQNIIPSGRAAKHTGSSSQDGGHHHPRSKSGRPYYKRGDSRRSSPKRTTLWESIKQVVSSTFLDGRPDGDGQCVIETITAPLTVGWMLLFLIALIIIAFGFIILLAC